MSQLRLYGQLTALVTCMALSAGKAASEPTLMTFTQLKALLGETDWEAPVKLSRNGRAISYGWELEFKPGSRAADGYAEQVNRGEIAYMDSYYLEESGNHEVRSKPGEKLTEALGQMQTTLDAVGKDQAKGFHLHMRIDKADIGVNEADFMGWLSRISDRIFAYRMEYYRPNFVLRTWSQVRLHPEKLAERGTVRIREIDGQWDIEIRGFMKDLKKVEEVAKIIATGAKRPTLIQGFREFQDLSFTPTQKLDIAMDEYLKRKRGRGLSTAERNRAQALEKALKVRTDYHDAATPNDPPLLEHMFPLLGIEHMPYIPESEKGKILAANETFLDAVERLLNDRVGKDARTEFRELLKTWVSQTGYGKLLTRSLLMEAPPELDVSPGLMARLAACPDQNAAKKVLRSLNLRQAGEAAAGQLTEAEADTLRGMLTARQRSTFDRGFDNQYSAESKVCQLIYSRL